MFMCVCFLSINSKQTVLFLTDDGIFGANQSQCKVGFLLLILMKLKLIYMKNVDSTGNKIEHVHKAQHTEVSYFNFAD